MLFAFHTLPSEKDISISRKSVRRSWNSTANQLTGCNKHLWTTSSNSSRTYILLKITCNRHQDQSHSVPWKESLNLAWPYPEDCVLFPAPGCRTELCKISQSDQERLARTVRAGSMKSAQVSDGLSMQKRKLRSYKMVNCLQIFGLRHEKRRDTSYVKGRTLAAHQRKAVSAGHEELLPSALSSQGIAASPTHGRQWVLPHHRARWRSAGHRSGSPERQSCSWIHHMIS